MNKEKLITDLYNIEAVKFGDFTLKSGMKSPIYIDLRITISYPEVLNNIADLMLEKIKVENLQFDIIAGIPYTALPIATIISHKSRTPMIFARKETKDYGTKRKIEGKYKKDDKVLIIDDLITTGESKFETAEPFESEGLKIFDFIVLVDREQGGANKLLEKGYNLHSIIKISEVLDLLKEKEKISKEQYEEVYNFLKSHQV